MVEIKCGKCGGSSVLTFKDGVLGKGNHEDFFLDIPVKCSECGKEMIAKRVEIHIDRIDIGMMKIYLDIMYK